MHPIDVLIIAGYMLAMVGVGLHFMRRQEGTDAYFVGDRRMAWGHVGLSVVATDVGGGFSIGLGGLGFAMGLSGSWLLFTGLVGAWAAAVLVIPRVKPLGDRLRWTTYPDFLAHRFGDRARVLAAVVSGVGYASFVGAQILAGATLLEGTFEIDRTVGVLAMAAVVILYTATGGLQAVVATDTIQWIVLLGGLTFVALPFAVVEAGGLSAVIDALPEDHLSLTQVSAAELATWAITIIPIWFVANTLYQRIYATRDLPSARRAWYLAGLLEWPAMAFIGAALGAVARVLLPELGLEDRELAVPLLIKQVLPVGVVGIVIAAYFSAIMSTADSCLLASVGHIMGDLYLRYVRPDAPPGRQLLVSRLVTGVVGAGSVAVALLVPTVLEAILLTYSFMVSGLFVPTLAALLWPRATARAAFWSIVSGGSTAVLLQIPAIAAELPGTMQSADPAFTAIPVSAVVLFVFTFSSAPPPARPDLERGR